MRDSLLGVPELVDVNEMMDRIERLEEWVAFLAPASAELGARPPATNERGQIVPPPAPRQIEWSFTEDEWSYIADACASVGRRAGRDDEVDVLRANARVLWNLGLVIRAEVIG